MAAPQPAPPAPENSEPALTRAALTSAISAVVLGIAGYVQQHTGLVTADDLVNLGKILAVVAPLGAAWLIRKLVVPVKKADAAANYFMAAGYAQGHQDGASQPDPIDVDEVRRQAVEEHMEAQRQARREQDAARKVRKAASSAARVARVRAG